MTLKTTITKDERLAIWLQEGRDVPEVKYSYDPVFDLSCFLECTSAEDLQSQIKGRYWSIGTAFYFRDICLINQVEGGSEFILFKGDKYIDSLSVNRMIEDDDFMAYLNLIFAK